VRPRPVLKATISTLTMGWTTPGSSRRASASATWPKARAGIFAAHGDGGWSVGGGFGGGQFGHNHGEKLGNRRPKINFPTFDGESDPLTWLNKCAMYFRGMRTTADERVWMASLHLEGVAAKWYYTLKRDVSLVTCLTSLNL
jgi:hypothetical protein